MDWKKLFIFLSIMISSSVFAAPPVVTSNSATGTVGTPFNYTITATNSPYGYTASGLPPGLLLDASTGVITGTPTATGTTVVSITATNTDGTGNGTVTITINPAAPVVTSNSATGTVGTPFNYTVTATNSPTSYSASGLPSGLNFDPSTGVISGTPFSAGTTIVPISATNAGGTGNGTVTITINPPAPVVTSNSATGTVGTPFNYTITATNSPTSYSATTLPPGLVFNPSTGVISGTPFSAGTTIVPISATNAGGTGNGTVTITINPAAPVVTSNSATGNIGTPFNYTITATNSPTSYTATGLPPGLNLDTSTGVISGTPSALGFTIVPITATNAGGTGNGTVTININPPIPVVTSNSATGTIGTPFNYTITATNSPTSYASGVLPPGLNLDTSTGVISGTPTALGTTIVPILAINFGGIGNGTVTITINPPAPVVTSNSATGNIGTPFNYAITATNSPTSYTATGLPPGLVFDTSTGIISGTPTASGTTIVPISATNSSGTGNGTVTITINLAVPVITSSTSATGTVRSPFSYQITATNTPTSFTATPLPPGLSFNASTGIISGIPTTPGPVSVTISATNSSGVGSAILTITISEFIPPNPTDDKAVTGLINAQKTTLQLYAQTNIAHITNHLRQLHNNSDLSHNNVSIGLRSALSQQYQDVINSSHNQVPNYNQNFQQRNFQNASLLAQPNNNLNEIAFPKLDSLMLNNLGLNDILFNKLGMAVWGAANTAYGKITNPGQVRDRFTLDEFIAGLDFKIRKQLIAGLAVNYSTNDNTLDKLDANFTSHQFSLSGYTTYQIQKNWFIDALIGYGSPSFDNKRQSMTSSESFYSNRNGRMTFGSVGLTNQFKLKTVMTQLFCRADLVSAQLNQFTEQGGNMALSYNSLPVSNTALSAGIVLSKNILFNSWIVTPLAKTQYSYNSGNNNHQDLFYTNLGPSQFSYNFNVGNISKNEGTVGLGVNLTKLQGGTIAIEWTESFGDYSFLMNTFNLRLSYPFA